MELSAAAPAVPFTCQMRVIPQVGAWQPDTWCGWRRALGGAARGWWAPAWSPRPGLPAVEPGEDLAALMRAYCLHCQGKH